MCVREKGMWNIEKSLRKDSVYIAVGLGGHYVHKDVHVCVHVCVCMHVCVH